MKDRHELISAVLNNQWLAAVDDPLDEPGARVVQSPEEFFDSIYGSAYAALCVEDRRQAETMDEAHHETVGMVGTQAFDTAWEKYPSAEFCALLSDDVRALTGLLFLDEPLRPFARERLQWYLRGRFPCGYEGSFPDGTWLLV